MKNTALIKDDINFLEYPMWTVSNKNKINSIHITRPNGFYEIKSPEGIPSRFDKLILYFLLSKLNLVQGSTKTTIVTTRYELAKNVLFQDKNFSKEKYTRIMLALKKWKAIYIRFEGIFVECENHTIKYFSILDYVSLDKKTKELIVKFNDQYITQLTKTNYYMLINFQEYKNITRPVAARLYEILTKNLGAEKIWPINILDLGELLTLEKRFYPSHILIALEPAIEELNEKTSLNFDFFYDKEKSVCFFRKKEKSTQASPNARLDQKKSSKLSPQL